MYVGSEHIFGHRTSEDELGAWGPFMHAKLDGVESTQAELQKTQIERSRAYSQEATARQRATAIMKERRCGATKRI
jgi:hypothetical protein